MTLTLRPSQSEGVDFLRSRPTAILADDTGLGKSAQAIRAADAVGAQRVLILCQAIGRVSWAVEAPKWQTLPRQIAVFGNKSTHVPTGPLVLIAAYSSLSTYRARKRFEVALSASGAFGGFDVVILDEAHHLAHPKSARTQAVYGNSMDRSGGVLDLVEAKHVWLLSATLQRGNASELFPHLRALFPAVLAVEFGHVPTLKEFTDRYCLTAETPYGTQILGNDPDQVSSLRERLRPFVLRRVKQDVARELGDVQHVELPVEIDAKKVLEAARGDAGYVDAYLDALDANDASADVVPPNVAAVWRALGGFKVAPAAEWAVEFLTDNPDRKLVIFAHHTEVIDGLTTRLEKFGAQKLDGSVLPGVRALRVAQFQNDPDRRVLVGQTVAAGTSITLTAAHDVLMVEQEWTPADNYQAISRVHRIGQTQPVTAYYLYAANTVDARIAARARRKTADFAYVFDPLTTTA